MATLERPARRGSSTTWVTLGDLAWWPPWAASCLATTGRHQRHQALLRAVLQPDPPRDRKAGQWQRPDRLPARGRPLGQPQRPLRPERLLILGRGGLHGLRLGTALADTFTAFNLWRIAGGVAIGLASNLSPMYIAEVAPAAVRGRLVAMNQFTIVSGILLAQVALRIDYLNSAPPAKLADSRQPGRRGRPRSAREHCRSARLVEVVDAVIGHLGQSGCPTRW